MLDLVLSAIRSAQRWLLAVTRPASITTSAATVLDLARSKPALVAENAMLRHQLVVISRTAGKRPRFSSWDRVLMVLLARANPAWREALMVAKPETVLNWHRSLFKIVWRRKSRPKGRKPRITPETIELIKQMARYNRLWGAERIRGELLKLGIRVCKRTIQKHMRVVRPPHSGGQDWSTFLHNHADQTWACDFLQTHDLLFRPIFAFVIIELP